MASRYANAFHGRKAQFLGNQAGRAPPAWKDQARKASAGQPRPGSKILLSFLPPDVGQEEVQTLFAKTVGPVQDAFIVYNSQGNSKGMAVVAFHNAGDAAKARQKYNGKIIDARRPIKIEIINDEDEGAAAHAAPAQPAVPSLLARLGGTLPTVAAATPVAPAQPKKRAPVKPAPQPNGTAPRSLAERVRKPARTKKGPKRVKKTAEQLDAEMEDYRANGTQDVKP